MNKVKLSTIAQVYTGFPFKGEKYSDYGIRTVRGENVTEGKLRWDTTKCWNDSFEDSENYLLYEDDIVVGMDGSKVGKNKARIRSNDLPLLLAQRVACVRAKKGNDQVFIYYLINNPLFEKYVFLTQTGSSVPHISKKQIEDYLVPSFNLSTQQKIASVLSVLDDKIELNNKINAELEAMAKTLYDYWFVQFEFPNENGKPYKSSGGKMVYNDVLKREIPEGWEVKNVGEVFQVSRGTLITKETSTEGNYKVVAAGINYSYLTGTFNREKFTITVSGSGANAGFINFWTEKIFASDCTTIRGENDFETFIALYLLKSYQDYIFSQAKGSAQPHVYPSDISVLKFARPNEKLIDNFGGICFSLFGKIANNQKQNQELSQLRDWLLPMLMNGQVKVTDVENDVFGMVAEQSLGYEEVANTSKSETKEDRFTLWLNNQNLAARGDINETVLREIFDAMDDEDQ